jgi:hypothetical protein
MVPLSHPLLRPEVEADQISHYSQKMGDAINLRNGTVESLPCSVLLERLDPRDVSAAFSVNENGHLTSPGYFAQPIDPGRACVTFENLLRKSAFVTVTGKVLRALRDAYRVPVDVEFAWEGGRFYLLQCRPFAIREFAGKVRLPTDLPPERIVFTTSRQGANRIVRDIEYIVYVDPKSYGRLDTQEARLRTGRVVSQANRALQGRRYALLGPGRWGSNDINLGVRVGYEDINHTLILGEVAFREGGSTPEVSYGTHFFNDLVEAEILPIAIYPDEQDSTLHETLLLTAPNQLAKLCPEFADYSDVVHVIYLPSVADGRLLQVFIEEEEGKGMGFLAHPEELEGEQVARPVGAAAGERENEGEGQDRATPRRLH